MQWGFILKIELKPSIQNRSLLAFLDLVILQTLVQRPMTGYGVNRFFVRKFGVMVGPSTIYAKLSAMERQGWVRIVRETHGRVYGITEQGQEIIGDMAAIKGELQSFIKIMLPS
jgi:DNA-binding PadR family transcriptional regulator